MKLFRLMIFALAAIGSAWATEQLIGPEASTPELAAKRDAPVVLAQAEEPAAGEADDSAGPVSAPIEIEQLSEDELQAELERIEQEAAGSDDELKEFKPSKPLIADLPVALPSDI